MNNPFSLKDKTIVVTGASSGIGAQCAIDCAAMGANVVLVARTRTRLNETLSRMAPGNHRVVSQDLTKIELMGNLVKDIKENLGPISGLVCCAGISSVTPLNLIKEDELNNMLYTNVYSSIFLTKEICKRGNFDKEGTSIVFLSSIMGLVGETAKTMYSLTKGALQSASKSLAVEMAPKKIRVNCIAPGTIITPININLPHIADPEKRRLLEAKHPLGLGETTDISNACVFLLSDAARWITGQVIAIDGGYTAK